MTPEARMAMIVLVLGTIGWYYVFQGIYHVHFEARP